MSGETRWTPRDPELAEELARMEEAGTPWFHNPGTRYLIHEIKRFEEETLCAERESSSWERLVDQYEVRMLAAEASVKRLELELAAARAALSLARGETKETP